MFNFFKKKDSKSVVKHSSVKFSIQARIKQFQFSQDGQHLYLLTVEGKLYDGKVYKRGDKTNEFMFNELNVKLPDVA